MEITAAKVVLHAQCLSVRTDDLLRRTLSLHTLNAACEAKHFDQHRLADTKKMIRLSIRSLRHILVIENILHISPMASTYGFLNTFLSSKVSVLLNLRDVNQSRRKDRRFNAACNRECLVGRTGRRSAAIMAGMKTCSMKDRRSNAVTQKTWCLFDGGGGGATGWARADSGRRYLVERDGVGGGIPWLRHVPPSPHTTQPGSRAMRAPCHAMERASSLKRRPSSVCPAPVTVTDPGFSAARGSGRTRGRSRGP